MCFEKCDSEVCQFRVTWNKIGAYVEFEVVHDVSHLRQNVWIAIGFSTDKYMARTSVVMCKDHNTFTSVELGYNPGHFYETITNVPDTLKNTKVSVVDGIFTCRFQRLIKVKHQHVALLSDELYMLVGQGDVDLIIGNPHMHIKNPVCSDKKLDFIRGNDVITTTPIPDVTLQPAPFVPDPRCGVTKGCFHSCDGSGDLCSFQVTWQEAGDYIDFTMSQNISAVDNAWIALGISDDTNMKNTSVIMCKDVNGNISVELGYNPGYAYTTVATNTRNLVLTSGSNIDGIFTCNFQRRKTITDFNNTFTLTAKRFLIVANGLLATGIPVKHTNEPTVSPGKQDFIHIVPETTTVNPGEITTQPGPIIPDVDCGVTKGCFSSCDDTRKCMFQVTWQEAGDYIEFTMSQNISAVDNTWIALGISDDTNMKNTSVILCKEMSGSISVELGYNPGYAYSTVATNTRDLIHTSGSHEDGIFTCSFQRRKTITDFNNTFTLTAKHFLVVANGLLSSGIPVKHTNEPTVSPGKQDFIHIVPETTTVNPGEITTQPGPIIPDVDCGVTKGCFSSCDDTRKCMFQVTWQEAGDYIEFTMSQNISAVDNTWIALGISDDTNMKNTSVILCKEMSGSISGELGYNPGYAYSTVATNTSDLIHTSGSHEDGIFTCSFQRRKTITDFNNTFTLTAKRFLIVANGLLSSGIPVKHTNEPRVSPVKQDFIHIVPEITTVNPGVITTQPGPIIPDVDCGVTKGCFFSCVSREDCMFQVTWQEAGDYIDFTMSQNISAVDNAWIALGISDDTNMKNTSVIMCKSMNGSISVELGYNPGYAYTTVATNTSDLIHTSGSNIDGIFTCSFQRRKTITDFNNTFTLTAKRFLIVTNGLLASGNPVKHTNEPTVSSEKQDFINVVPETTTPGPYNPDVGCGVTKGCFFSCVSREDCMFQVTWQEAGDYIDFTMSQNISAVDNVWIALGISDDSNMKNTSVIMCKDVNGNISVELGYNPGYAYTTVETNTSDLIFTSGSHIDGVFMCNFQRRKTITDFNNTFALTNKHYLIVGNGPLSLSSGIPTKHQSDPTVSPNKEDFIHFVPDTTPTNPGELTTQSGSSIVKDPECGKSKGCFSDCDNQGQSCTCLVTWQNEVKAKTIQFEIASIVSPSMDDWIAIGLSPKAKMAKSSVMMCVLENGVVTTELGYNTKDRIYVPLTNKTEYLSHMSGSIDGSVMRCTFQRASTVSNPLNTDSAKIFDLEDEWYLLFAHGLAPSGVPERHKDKPKISKSKVNFLKTGDVGLGKQTSGLVKLHGFLMIVAWIILSTSGMLIARYFKPIFHQKVKGKHLWFQFHRTCMCTVVVLTLTALIAILVEVGGISKISVPDDIAYVKLHPLLGLIIVLLMLLNPAMAFFRCDHDSAHRPIFNWLHWGVAFVVQFISGFNISFGFHLNKVNMPVNDALFVMYMYTGTFVSMYIVFEITKCVMKRNAARLSNETDEFAANISLTDEEEAGTPNFTCFKIIFGVHIVAMLSYGTTLIVYLLDG
ncbi:uncharacterized protein LOC110459088 [Mizuhopecten yessoensis]|nr:uncharacterized protein LOC110459088 [Mizuhopecten yessoensis]